MTFTDITLLQALTGSGVGRLRIDPILIQKVQTLVSLPQKKAGLKVCMHDVLRCSDLALQ